MLTPIRQLRSFVRDLDSHSQELLRGAWVALALRMLGAGLTFLLSFLLARILGPEGAGLYFLSFGVLSVAGVAARLGLGDSLVRFTSTGAAAEEWPALESLARRALTLGATAGVLVTVVLLAAAPWLAEVVFEEPRLTGPLRIMILAVLPFVLLTLVAQLLRGRKRIAQSLAVSSALPVGLTCVGVLLLAPQGGARGATMAYLVATLVTLLVAVAWWWVAIPRDGGTQGHFPLRTLLASSIPLFWTSLSKMLIDRSPGLFLGFFAGAQEVGILEVANRTALLVSFTLVAVNSIAGPKFAELYGSGETEALVRTARRSAMLTIAAALPMVLVLVTVPGIVMGIFGDRFTAGASVLVILALGQLVNAGTGSVALLLVMTGHERVMRNVTVTSLLMSIVLYVATIPLWGMHGAAVTYATTVAFNNLVAVLAVRRLLGVWIFPRLRLRGRGRSGGGGS